jgi:hypothetical protein
LIIHIISSEFLAIPKNLEGALRRRGIAIDWPITLKGCRIFDANNILLNVLHRDGDHPVANPHSLRMLVTEVYTETLVVKIVNSPASSFRFWLSTFRLHRRRDSPIFGTGIAAVNSDLRVSAQKMRASIDDLQSSKEARFDEKRKV